MATVNLMEATHLTDIYRNPYNHENKFVGCGFDICNETTVAELFKSIADYYMYELTDEGFSEYCDGTIYWKFYFDPYSCMEKEVEIALLAWFEDRVVEIPLSDDPLEEAHCKEVGNKLIH